MEFAPEFDAANPPLWRARSATARIRFAPILDERFAITRTPNHAPISTITAKIAISPTGNPTLVPFDPTCISRAAERSIGRPITAGYSRSVPCRSAKRIVPASRPMIETSDPTGYCDCVIT